ncbi:hypothetical protein EMIT0373P_30301 [Pseudomonas chlororaphis]
MFQAGASESLYSCHIHRQRTPRDFIRLTQTFDFACGLLHCAPGVTGINFANFTQRPLTVRLELFSQHETDSAAPRCASA